MYEQFKNDFIYNLEKETEFNLEQVELIMKCLNKTAYNYDFKTKETQLMLYNNELPKLAEMFIVSKKIEGYAKGTLYNYTRFLTKFFFEVKKAPEQVETNDIRVYLYKYQEERGISNRSLEKIRGSLASFYKWMCVEGYIEKNPMTPIKQIKYEKKEKKSLEQIELEYLRKSCKTEKEKAIVEFLYITGCRVSELCGVKLTDINFDKKTVIVLGKGIKYRTVMLNAKSIVTLESYMKVRKGNSDFLFVSDRYPYEPMHVCGIQKIIKLLCERTSKERMIYVTPHILRHTMATTARKSGMPIENISKLLGHSNINTTLIYAKTNNDEIRVDHEKYIV